MRSIRELYRLKFEAGLSHQQIARALQISKVSAQGTTFFPAEA